MFVVASCATDNTGDAENQESSAVEGVEEKVTPVAPKANLLDGKWEAIYIEGAPRSMEELYPEGYPTITFNTGEGRVSGNSSCNNFTGSFSLDGTNLTWEGQLASTRKMCPEMDGEKAFLAALNKSNGYSISERGRTLDLIRTGIAGTIGTIRLTRINE